MSILTLAKEISNIDEIETWNEHFPNSYSGSKKDVFEIAQPLWVERMISEQKLFVHPNIIKQLKEQYFQPNDLQNRMVWASVLGSANPINSKQRFYVIKKRLLNKYGRDWWEDVYKRKNNVWAVKERIRKKTNSNGVAVNTLINSTHLFGNAVQSEIESALKMIPEI
jgi:hypothetical protein